MVMAVCAAVAIGAAGLPVASVAASPLVRGQASLSLADSGASGAHRGPVYDKRQFRHPRPRRVAGNETYYCKYHANTPFWLTHESSKLYGTGSIYRCSNPPPTGCHMIVDLEQLRDEGGVELWVIVATGDKGWRACSTSRPNNTTTTSYTCQSTLFYREWRDVVTVAIEYPGGSEPGGPAVSDTANKLCE